MKQQSNKKLQVFGIGENVLLPIPQVDKRSHFDPQNLPGVILNCNDEGLYQIGTTAGRLEAQYTGGQLELSLSFFIAIEEVPNKAITLREAILHSSHGKHHQFCDSKRTCNSKCHRAFT
eukprot:TRINITY_DN7712_c0_g1_i3.p1 TRINITY_DN7712_c0_g1~~TRINITY_DN7712_c0_g1_i3.p1  ORF type:complete len:119 (-),score=13.90 TRINITY_DN7712_c0_g1_i3:47-403(-)